MALTEPLRSKELFSNNLTIWLAFFRQAALAEPIDTYRINGTHRLAGRKKFCPELGKR
jgi:hypothetical protein